MCNVINLGKCRTGSWDVDLVELQILQLLVLLIELFINTRTSVTLLLDGFGGLEVACWPLVPKFASSNPTEAVGFFRAKKKTSTRLPSEGK